MELYALVNTVYVVAAITVILGFRLMGNAQSARRGLAISAVGMCAAVVVTLMDARIGRYDYILVGMAAGTAAGLLFASRTAMSGVLRQLGLLNACGGLASLLVSWSAFHTHPEGRGIAGGIALWLTAVAGAAAFSGALVVRARLGEKINGGRPLAFAGQQYAAIAVLTGIFAAGVLFSSDTVAPEAARYFTLFSVLALAAGVLLVLPGNVADMPAFLCLLNGCSGVAVCASGFVVHNSLLVAVGALVGAGCVALSLEMCRETNRAPAEVLFGGFRAPETGDPVKNS